MIKRTLYSVVAALSLGVTFAVAARAHPATGIVVDRGRRVVYFSDLETVWKIDAADRLSTFRAGVRGRHTHELAIDPAGNVFGGDLSYDAGRWTSAYWRSSPAGEFTYLLPPSDGFARGWGVQRDAAGNAYKVEQDNNRKRETLLLRRAPDGRVERIAGGAYGHADGRGAGARFGSISGLAVAQDGTVFLADGPNLRRVTPDGVVTTVERDIPASDPDARLAVSATTGGLAGLALGGRGDLYVADYGNRRILRVGEGGRVATVLRSEHPWSPTGVADGGDGTIYALEVSSTLAGGLNGSRVRRLAPDGSIKTLATVGAQGQAGDGPPTRCQRAAARFEQFASSESGTRLYLALAYISIGFISLAIHLARCRNQ